MRHPEHTAPVLASLHRHPFYFRICFLNPTPTLKPCMVLLLPLSGTSSSSSSSSLPPPAGPLGPQAYQLSQAPALTLQGPGVSRSLRPHSETICRLLSTPVSVPVFIASLILTAGALAVSAFVLQYNICTSLWYKPFLVFYKVL